MRTIDIHGPVHSGQLHQAIEHRIGGKLIGISDLTDRIEILLTDDVTPDEERMVQEEVQAHDISQLTAAQQAEANRVAALESLRKPWDQWTAADQKSFIRILAEQAGILPQG